MITLDTSNVKLSPIESLIKNEQQSMSRDLQAIATAARKQIRAEPSLYIDHGTDEPTIDVRLCIDRIGSDFEWCFRTGDSSFDQRHTTYCGASCIGLDTDVKFLLLNLISQILEQEMSI